METKELANRLRALETCATNQDQENACHALRAELEQDGLELVVDEDHCFAVREAGRAEKLSAVHDWQAVADTGPVALSADNEHIAILPQGDGVYTVEFAGQRLPAQSPDQVNGLLARWEIPPDQGWSTH